MNSCCCCCCCCCCCWGTEVLSNTSTPPPAPPEEEAAAQALPPSATTPPATLGGTPPKLGGRSRGSRGRSARGFPQSACTRRLGFGQSLFLASLGMEPPGGPTEGCPLGHTRRGRLWEMRLQAGFGASPASDVLSARQIAPWRVLLLTGLVLAPTVQACPAGTVPFRAMQCSLYDSKPILGGQTRYQWVPFHGAANLCDLNCLAVGHNFYYTFGRVLDGTPCSPALPDLCISGRCLRAGCDGILGSDALADACGVCAGRNESCVFVQEAFWAAFPTSGFSGYRNVTRIPAGARQIRVTDRSRNYLALMNADQHYVLNGEWAIDQPGAYEVVGTKWHYTRTGSVHETLEAAGPTSEDLFLMDPAGSATCRGGNRTACSTTAPATSSSEPGSSPSATSARRRATTCRCSGRTATASRCSRASTSGCPTPATAPRCWSSASTCSWRGATSTTSTPSTGSCCSAAATPGPGRPARTCCCVTRPRVASPARPPEPSAPTPQAGAAGAPRLLSAPGTPSPAPRSAAERARRRAASRGLPSLPGWQQIALPLRRVQPGESQRLSRPPVPKEEGRLLDQPRDCPSEEPPSPGRPGRLCCLAPLGRHSSQPDWARPRRPVANTALIPWPEGEAPSHGRHHEEGARPLPVRPVRPIL
ncbi:ADAMTS-like protein 5 isoform 2-T2 [Liasis olivaceus]